MKGVGEVRKENVVSDVMEEWSFDRRIGWEFCSLLRAVWKREMSMGFVRRSDRTAIPVPPRIALHQLCSVPPTVRPFASTVDNIVKLVTLLFAAKWN